LRAALPPPGPEAAATIDFPKLLNAFTSAIKANDAPGFIALFTDDAMYEDAVYGTFTGHAELKRMLRGLFHQDATDFHWEASDLGCGGSVGYANYRWS
jgi:ketosteroid isomerase-like protein